MPNSQTFPTPLDYELQTSEESLAIVVNGDVAPTGGLAANKYIFLKNHSTLPNGGYHVGDTAISAGATLSLSNLVADEEGIANALSSNLAKKQWTYIATADTAGTPVGVNLSGYSEILLIMKDRNNAIRNSGVCPTSWLPNRVNVYSFFDGGTQFVRLENGNSLQCGANELPAVLYAR